MRMIIAGIVAAGLLAIVAGLVLSYTNQSAGTRFQTENVRQ